MDASSEAAMSQTSGGYAVDAWLNIALEPMTKVWQGIGGHSNFFFSEEDARWARGSYVDSEPYRFAESLWRMAQVEPSPTLSFRQGIAEFVVDLATPAAIGICLANPQLGSGSVYQYYIPDWSRTLHPTGRTYQFAEKELPRL